MSAITEQARDFWDRISPRERGLVVHRRGRRAADDRDLARPRDPRRPRQHGDSQRQDAQGAQRARRPQGARRRSSRSTTRRRRWARAAHPRDLPDQRGEEGGLRAQGHDTPRHPVHAATASSPTRCRSSLDDLTIEQLKEFLQEIETDSRRSSRSRTSTCARDFKGKDKLDVIARGLDLLEGEAGKKPEAAPAAAPATRRAADDALVRSPPRPARAQDPPLRRLSRCSRWSSFVFAFQLTFPFDRASRTRSSSRCPTSTTSRSATSSAASMPGRVYFKAVTLRTRPTKADEPRPRSTSSSSRSTSACSRCCAARCRSSSTPRSAPATSPATSRCRTAAATSASSLGEGDLPSASLPMREVLGLPMSGKVEFAVDLDLPNETSQGRQGHAELAQGRGHLRARLPVGLHGRRRQDQAQAARSRTTRQQASSARAASTSARSTSTRCSPTSRSRTASSRSPSSTPSRSDGELHVDFAMTLNQDFNDRSSPAASGSTAPTRCSRREPKTHAAISDHRRAGRRRTTCSTSSSTGPLRDDARSAMVCGPSSQHQHGRTPGGAPPRPNLRSSPEPASPRSAPRSPTAADREPAAAAGSAAAATPRR